MPATIPGQVHVVCPTVPSLSIFEDTRSILVLSMPPGGLVGRHGNKGCERTQLAAVDKHEILSHHHNCVVRGHWEKDQAGSLTAEPG